MPSSGVVIIICIFVCALVGGAAVLLVWLCRRNTPSFHHLDEVPMVSGGGRGLGGSSGAKLWALTPFSLSSLEQSDGGVSHHQPHTQVTHPPPPQPPRAPYAAE